MPESILLINTNRSNEENLRAYSFQFYGDSEFILHHVADVRIGHPRRDAARHGGAIRRLRVAQ